MLPSALLTFAELLLQILWIAILIRVLLTWFPIDPNNPIIRVLFEITEPVLAPIRRLLPPMSGLDLSPLVVWLVAIVLIQFLGSLH